MSVGEVDALLERLVAQFESPYDFLRELVQNAMDAGSDRIEVALETHAVAGSSGEAAEVVFELSLVDSGAGMDEAIIDEELTRLFSSGKAGDRTTAGGFGIGFVSVFAWQPDAVLVHTGRAGESWELVFHGDRSFEKVALDQPLEGTSVSLLRRGRGSEREAIAEAIRDSLWRWCRYCPVELSFEDLDGDEPPELIQDAPEPAELGMGAVLTRTRVEGETSLRVSFAVPPQAVLLRRGLILAEGGPRELLPRVAVEMAESCDHLQVWADSPLLRTTLARDKVVDDGGRATIEARLLELIVGLREDLLAELEELVAGGAPEPGEGEREAERVDPSWTRERHAVYSALHAHASLERRALGSALRRRPLLRDLAHGRALSLDGAIAAVGPGRPLLVAVPPRLASQDGELGVLGQGLAALLRDLGTSELPVVTGSLVDDGPWLTALAELGGVELRPVEAALARVRPGTEEGAGLAALVERLLAGLELERLRVGLGEFVDLRGEPLTSPVFGAQVEGAAAPLAFHGHGELPLASLAGRRLWFNRQNALIDAALVTSPGRPLLAGLALATAVVGRCTGVELGELARVAAKLEWTVGG